MLLKKIIFSSSSSFTTLQTSKRLFHSTTSNNAPKKCAVLLAGSGVYDGSEITEAVATLVHLSRHGADVQCFAPDKMQLHTVNHTSGEEEENNRNVLLESARIARGDVKALSDLSSADFDCLVIPGGFGAAKNLFNADKTWAVNGPDGIVDENVSNAINDFHHNNKAIGACCIAPVLLAKTIDGVSLTVGSSDTSNEAMWPYAGTAGQMESIGAKHVDATFDEAVIDESNKVVTSAAYMYNGKPHEVFDSVGNMIEAVLKL